MSEDRTHTALALLGAAFAGLVALLRPDMIPALTFAVAVWVAMCIFLKV